MRMIRTDTQGLTTIHDILTQSEGETGYAFLCLFISYRIIVKRTEHTTHRWVEAGAIILTHHLLQDNRHLLLVDDVAGGSHIRLGITIEHGGIHALDGTSQHLKHLIFILKIRNHIGRIDTGKRLIVRILKKRTGTDGDRTLRCLEEGEEVSYQGIRQLRMQKMLQYLIIAGIAQRYRIEIVAHHKFIEDIGTEHHGFRNLHGGILILIELQMALNDIVEKGKSSTLSAQGSLANAGKVGIFIELHSIKHCNNTQVLHVAILHNGIKDNLPVGIHILQLLPGDVLQEGGNREDGTGTEPAAHVVAADMIEHRIVGDVEDVILQLLQTADAHDFLVGFRIAEDEIAEAHVLLHQATEIHTHLLGVLIYEAESLGFCLGTVVALGTLDDKRHERISLADVTEEAQSGIGTFLTTEGIGAVLGIHLLLHLVAESLGGTLQRESGIADDTQGIVGILIVEFLRLFVGTGEHHLRTATHSHRGSMAVEGFLGKILALLEDIAVEVWQDGTVEAHGVFYQEYHLHACLPDIVL